MYRISGVTGGTGEFARTEAEPLRLEPRAGRVAVWLPWAGLAFSFILLAAIVGQLREFDPARLAVAAGFPAAFWGWLAAYYLAPIASDWIIFRRLWHIPLSGLLPLARKYVSNELLLGYSGELSFYLWARSHAEVEGAPFGAVKDVAILSAVAGNGVTLTVMAAAWPLLARLHTGVRGELLYASGLVLVFSSLAVFLLRRRLFSLPWTDLRFVACVQVVRVAAMPLLAAGMWASALPTVGLSWWLLLAALRLGLSRLPFLPNKEVAFAGLAVLLIGGNSGVSGVLATIAVLTVGAHIVVGVLTSATGFLNKRAAA